MSSLTIFLVKFLGLYCIVLALAMIIRKQSKIGAIKALISDPPLLLLAEVLALAAGIAMIVGHNIWSGGVLPVVITLFGWLLAIRDAGLHALSPAAVKKAPRCLAFRRALLPLHGRNFRPRSLSTYSGFST